MSALKGYRVLDLGIVTAGAGATAILADLGAEVIKIESPTYRDPFRQWSADTRIDADAPVPPFFRATNRNKAGISIDLKSPDGREIFLRLLEQSDIVVENFRRGVMNKLGLDYAALKQRNPEVILVSVASQGETGPDADYVSFGTTLEAVSGMAWLTGYEGDAPFVTGVDVNYPDQVTTIFAAGLITAAIMARRAGRGGAHIDLSQRELASYLIGEAFIAPPDEASARQGNRQEPYALQDCFRAQDGVWVALSVLPTEMSKLAHLLAHEPDAGDLAQHCATWISGHDAKAAVDLLTTAGLSAAPSLDGHSVMKTRGTGWDMALATMPDGAMAKGFPFQLDHHPLTIQRDAPKLGDDTRDVLTRVGRYTHADVDDLIARKIIEQRGEKAP